MLLKLLWELELWNSECILSLTGLKVYSRQLLLLWDHSHVDILLVRGSDLLLLLLQELNLLLQGKLFHYPRSH